MYIINGPWAFKSAWSVIQGWLDENTRNKISIQGTSFKAELLKHIDEDQLPDFLGGNNTQSLKENPGPWNDYEIVDGQNKDDIVGIRKISDGPNGVIFTPLDLESLPNPQCKDPQNAEVAFNQHKR